MKKTLLLYFDTFLNFIFPRNIYCILCNEPIKTEEKYSLCPKCREKTPFITSRECEHCGKPLESLYLPTKCPDCIITKHYFNRGFSCVEYNDDMKELVYRLKYGKQRYLSYHMAQIMADKLKNQILDSMDLVVPVPLYKKKQRERGFNQAQLLARYIGEFMDWPLDTKNLVRIRNTDSQNKLNRDERQENMKNAFKLVSGEIFEGKNLLLVDDIYTTGSTIDACCRELLKAKPKTIYVITFATGRNT